MEHSRREGMLARRQQREEPAGRRAQLHAELVERIAWLLPEDGAVQPLPGLSLYRFSRPSPVGRNVSFPSFCVIAQGSKELWFGAQRLRYDPAHYLVVTAELPYASQIIEASPERPYLSLTLALDPTVVRSVLVEAGGQVARSPGLVRAAAVSALDADLLDAVVRLVRLVDVEPERRSFLVSLVVREIVYRLCIGEQGHRLEYVALASSQSRRVMAAVERLRTAFAEPLRIDELARELAMSVSSLHHQFKAVTGLSPLQFQKQLRLLEARRLLLSEGWDVTSAAQQVGYRDLSHFSRDYKRLFGVPPARDCRQRAHLVTLPVSW